MSAYLAERVMETIADRTGCHPSRLRPLTDLFRDLGVDGADAHELLRLSEKFEIDVQNVQFHRHVGPEGFNPLALLLPAWWRRRRERIPVTIADLVEAARTGSWPIRYNEGKSA